MDAFRLIVVYGVARSVASPAGQIVNAVGRPDIALKWNVALLPILVPALFVGAQYGVLGVAAAIAIVLGVAAWIWLLVVFRFMRWEYRLVWESIKALLISASVMAILVQVVRHALRSIDQPRYLILAVSVLVGMLIYSLIMRMFFRHSYEEAATFIRQVLGDVRLGLRGRAEHAKAGWFEG